VLISFLYELLLTATTCPVLITSNSWAALPSCCHLMCHCWRNCLWAISEIGMLSVITVPIIIIVSCAYSTVVHLISSMLGGLISGCCLWYVWHLLWSGILPWMYHLPSSFCKRCSPGFSRNNPSLCLMLLTHLPSGNGSSLLGLRFSDF